MLTPRKKSVGWSSEGDDGTGSGSHCKGYIMGITSVAEWDAVKGGYRTAISFQGRVIFCDTFEEGVAALRSESLTPSEKASITKQLKKDQERLERDFGVVVLVCKNEKELAEKLVADGWIPGREWKRPLKQGDLLLQRTCTWNREYRWRLKVSPDGSVWVDLETSYSAAHLSFARAIQVIDRWKGCFSL